MKPALSLYDTLVGWALQTPAAPFVIEADSGRTLSYGACLDAVHGLLNWLGEKPSTIALALPGSRATSVAWLAALSGGHTLVPASTDATEDERWRLTARYTPDVIIAPSDEIAAGFGCPEARILTGEQLDGLIDGWIAAAPEPRPAPDNGFLCLTTSGTTGIPKGVRLRADQVAWTADQIRQSHGLTQADRGLAVLPFFHINAPVVSLCSTLMAGGTVVIAPRFSRSRFWSWIERYRITWASIVPTVVAVLLRTDPPEWLPGTLQFVRTASAPLPVVHLHQFEQRFGVPVIETYGLSEAASTISANPVPPGRHKPGTVGVPLGVQLRVCEPNL
ncbi:MAG TPA: AMP-binding protein, partial [Thermomicrobiaceae bacterium]|nr:AMP-binding protein [Thermomicrobiaceae bacterium]